MTLDLSWFDDAACRNVDPDIFFPERGDDVSAARVLCLGCPVFDPCFEFGLRQKHGIWAGTSERERRRIRHARGIRIHDDIDDPDLGETA